MQLSTGMTQNQAANLLGASQTWTNRQQMLTEAALGSLDRDMEWSKFLAEFGMRREEFMEMATSGRLAALLPILQMYKDQVALTMGGMIPYDVYDPID